MVVCPEVALEDCPSIEEATPDTNFKVAAGENAVIAGICKTQHKWVVECYKATLPKETKKR